MVATASDDGRSHRGLTDTGKRIHLLDHNQRGSRSPFGGLGPAGLATTATRSAVFVE
jgi:hypothetical protein